VSLVVTSFYTDTWEYPAHAERLRAECDALGLGHHIVERPDAGPYLANCRQKPVHLLETLRALGRPLLWVDVDGSIVRAPEDMDGVDFAGVRMAPDRDRAWHVGTMYFGATEAAEALLRLWVRALDSETSDEAAFDRAWRSGRWRGEVRALPPRYMACGRWANVYDPVVVHRTSCSQAKRAFRRQGA
jgi:hypothetical protein